MKDKSKGLALGAAIGAVAGVVTGMLFAPKSGKETRKDIKDTASKAAQRFNVEAKKLEKELSALVKKSQVVVKKVSKTVAAKLVKLEQQAIDAQEMLIEVYKSLRAGKANDKELDLALQKAKESRDALKTYLKKHS